MERCCYIKHGKEWIFIPGCMGGAASGPHACTCLNLEERVELLEKRLEILQAFERDLQFLIEQVWPGETIATIHIKAKQAREAKMKTGAAGLKLRE